MGRAPPGPSARWAGALSVISWRLVSYVVNFSESDTIVVLCSAKFVTNSYKNEKYTC